MSTSRDFTFFKNLNKFCLTAFIFLSAVIVHAGPGRTTYQAKIVKPDGYPLENNNVNFKFTIMDPSGTCILFAETYSSVNMNSTGGLISFSLGSGVKVFPASATTFEDVFSNITPTLSCDAGGPPTYSPASSDTRKIVMQFHDGSGWQTLPAMNINAVPYAMFANNADRLGGENASSYLRPSTLPSCGVSEALRYSGSGFSCVGIESAATAVTSASVATALGYTPANDTSVAALSTAFTSLTNSVAASFSAITGSGITSSAAAIAEVLGYTPAASEGVVSSQWTSYGSNIGYTSGYVGIGTSSPVTPFSVVAPGSSVPLPGWINTVATPFMSAFTDSSLTGAADFLMAGAMNSAGNRPVLLGRKSRGTLASPTALATGDTVYSVLASGYDGHLFANAASLDFVTSGAISSGTIGMDIVFKTGVTTRVERMRLDSNGHLAIGTASPTAILTLKSGNTSYAPLKLTSGALLTSPQSGTIEYDGFNFYTTNGAGVRSPIGTAGSGVGTFNGSTSSTQTLAFGNSGTAPSFSTVNGVHTLNIPFASVGTTTAGLISNTDYINFTNKVSSQWNTSGTSINYMDGNVGIGVTNPLSLLDVSGTIRATQFIGGVYATSGTNTALNGLLTLSGYDAIRVQKSMSYDGGSWANIFVGDAGNTTNTGTFNNAFGGHALGGLTTGSSNVAMGYDALNDLTTGGSNVAMGRGANGHITTGSNNIAIGYNAGYYAANSADAIHIHQSVALGANSRYLSNSSTNEIVIGYNAIGGGSNTVTIGSSAITKTMLSGNVGIGTSTTTYTLNVSGTIASTSGGYRFPDNTTQTTAFVSSAASVIQMLGYTPAASGAWITQGANVYYTAGNVGIGVNNPVMTLDVSGSARLRGNETGGSRMTFNNSSTGGRNWVINSTGSSSVGGAGKFHIADYSLGYDNFAFDHYSRFGVGTYSPLAPIHIVSATAYMQYDDSTTTQDFLTGVDQYRYFVRQGSLANNDLFTITNSGHVGIGVSSPGVIAGASKYLSVVDAGGPVALELRGREFANAYLGQIDFSRASGTDPVLQGAIIGAKVGTYVGSADLLFSTNSGTALAERMRINSNGNVGIGTTNPTSRLTVSGTIELSSSASGLKFSDGSSQTVAAIRPVYFTSNNNVTINGSASSGTLSTHNYTAPFTGYVMMTYTKLSPYITSCTGGNLGFRLRVNGSPGTYNNLSFITGINRLGVGDFVVAPMIDRFYVVAGTTYTVTTEYFAQSFSSCSVNSIGNSSGRDFVKIEYE